MISMLTLIFTGVGILLCKAIGSRSVIFHLDGSQEALVKIANSAIANEAL
jgi:hypothetical protein